MLVTRAMLLAVLALAATACAVGDEPYTREQVVRAFAAEGFELTSRPPLDTFAGGDVLVPESGEPFLVAVHDDVDSAEDAERALASQQTRESFEIRRRNVVVVSDTGSRAAWRPRVDAAMRRLTAEG